MAVMYWGGVGDGWSINVLFNPCLSLETLLGGSTASVNSAEPLSGISRFHLETRIKNNSNSKLKIQP